MAIKESHVFLNRLRHLVDNDTQFGQFLGLEALEPVSSVAIVRRPETVSSGPDGSLLVGSARQTLFPTIVQEASPQIDTEHPVCRAESSDFKLICEGLIASECGSAQWNANFVFWDEPAIFGHVQSVRQFLKVTASSNDERRLIEQAVLDRTRTTWSKEAASRDAPNVIYTYNVSAPCCAYEIHLRVSDKNGLSAECSFSNGPMPHTNLRYSIRSVPYSQVC